jgi:ectoine hydroxylase-related dioxygenase (phytanoyl-CoA dioxygenase family)
MSHRANSSYKISDVYLVSDGWRRYMLHPPLTETLTQLLNDAPAICNSLHLERGSQQPRHYDTWFMPPPESNRMAVSFIALDPIDESNGPLMYWPASHKIPPYLFSDGRINVNNSELQACYDYVDTSVAERGLSRSLLSAEPGDVFIWHAQLLHGGAPIADFARTRRSVVTHYWTNEAVRRSGWTTLPSHGGYYIERPHQPVPSESISVS